MKTKRVPKMEWSPVCSSSMVTWQALGRNIDSYKAGWKYIHRKQWPENDNSNATKEKAIALDGGETRTIDELIETFDRLAVKKEYDKYLGKNEAFKSKWRKKKMKNVSVSYRSRTPERRTTINEKLNLCRVQMKQVTQWTSISKLYHKEFGI
ncbi:hypothetical protein BDC45DRAFT_570586 [Circinella umbellata]|nr:hypothetical protein BDC45DRAFT_570586 [Circinella umbellata]